MSDDGVRRCKEDSYSLLPIHIENAFKRRVRGNNGDQYGTDLIQRHRQRRSRITCDISFIKKTLISTQVRTLSSHSSSLKRSRFINVCLIVLIHLICNEFVCSVNCDELLDAAGARGHYTHTWALHIPGGTEVAQKVADDHNMHLRGMVSRFWAIFFKFHGHSSSN